MKSLLIHKRFTHVILTVSASSLGAGMFSYALLLEFSSNHGQEWKGGLILSIYFIVKILASPSLGTWVDYVKNKYQVLLSNQAGGIILYLPMLMLDWRSDLSYVLIVILLIMEIVLNRMSIAAVICLIKSIGKNRDDVGRYLSIQNFCERSVGFLAPLLGPILLVNFGLKTLILINIATYIPASILIFLSMKLQQESVSKKLESATSYRRIFRESIVSFFINAKRIWHNRQLLTVVLMIMFFNAPWSVFPLYLSTKVSEGTYGGYWFSAGMGAFTLGSIVTSIVLAKGVLKPIHTLSSMAKGFGCLFVCVLGFTVVVSKPFEMLLYFSTGVLSGWLSLSLSAAAIHFCPAERIGGIHHTISSLGNIISPLSVALYGVLVAYGSPTGVFVVIHLVAVLTLVAIVCLMSLHSTIKQSEVKHET